MAQTVNGRVVRNALLGLAQTIRDDEVKSISQWLDEVSGTIQGNVDGSIYQRDLLRTISMMVEHKKSLRSISEMTDWSAQSIGLAIREYGKEYGLDLVQNSAGSYEVRKA